jgi:hypothetical protein
MSDALNNFNDHKNNSNTADRTNDAPLPKLHPKFNVDPSFTAHLLRQSPNNIPAHLQPPASHNSHNHNGNGNDNKHDHHNNRNHNHSDKQASFRPTTPTTEYDGPKFIPSPRAAEHTFAPPNVPVPPAYYDPYGHRAPHFSPDGLPILNADQFSRRVKLQLTTIDDILIFYTQLMNQSRQWGSHTVC